MAMCCFEKNRIVLFLFFFSVLIFGAEKDPFSFSLSKKIKYFDGKENKKIVKLFLKKWDSDSFTLKEKELITHFVSEFENRSFNQDYYINLFLFCNSLDYDESDKLYDWLNASSSFLVNLSDKDLDLFLMTNNLIEKDQTLFNKQDFSWSFSGDCSLIFRNNVPHYVLNLDSLILFNDNNQIVFYDTQGEFNLFDEIFYGNEGYLGWERIGVPIKDRYVLLDSFELDFSERKINLDNVKLVNNSIFFIESEGRFVDYLSRSESQNSYPKFYAKNESLTGDFFNGFSCLGLINILRDKIYFKSIDESPVELFYKDDYISAKYMSKSFRLSDSYISSGSVSAKTFFLNTEDSIFHPEMGFSYNHLDNIISLNRLNNTYLSDKPILNSFHSLNIYADFLKINLEEDKLFFLHPCFNQENNILFESTDYYNDDRYNDLNMFSSNILDLLFGYINNHEKRKGISISEFSFFLNIDFFDAVHIIKSLEIFDLVSFNATMNQFDVKDRAFSFFASKEGKYDFDQLSFQSSCFLGDTLSSLNMADMIMTIHNVSNLNLQPNSNYSISLKDNDIHLYGNRSFFMNAQLNFDNFHIYSDSIIFDYQDFSLYFPDFSDFKIINKNLDKNIECVENISFKNGFIQLDSVANKSGVVDIYDFPKFHFSDSTFVYGEDVSIKLVLNPQTISYFDEMALENIHFNGFLTMDNGFEKVLGDVNFNKSSGIEFNSNVSDLVFGANNIFNGELFFHNKTLRLAGELVNSDFIFQSNDFLVNNFSVKSRSGDLEFNINSIFPTISANSVSMGYVLNDSVIFSSNKKRLFNLYDNFRFLGDIILDFNSDKDHLFAKGHLLGNDFSNSSIDIFSEFFLFGNKSFISANSDVFFSSNNRQTLKVNGVSVEFLKDSNNFFLIRGDLEFEIPYMKSKLDFQASLIDFKKEEITFFNFNDSNGLLKHNNFDHSIKSVFLDFHFQKTFLSIGSFLDLGRYKVFPKDTFIEIDSNGIPLSFVAKKIKKKRIGKDLILLDKKVSFDQKMNCLIED